MRPPRLLVVVVAVAIGLFALTRGVLPLVLEDQLTSLATDAGLDLTVRDLTLSLLSGTVSLAGISVAELDARGEPFFVTERASVELHWVPLLDGRIHLAHARLGRGRFLGSMDENGFQIPGRSNEPDGVVAEPEPQSPESEASAGWPLLLDIAAIDALDVGLTLADGTHVDATVSISVERFATEHPESEGGAFPVTAIVEIADGRVEFQGEATLAGAVQGEIQLRELSIPALAGIAAPALDAWWAGGGLDADLVIDVTTDAAVSASGELAAKDIGFRAPSGEGLSVQLPAIHLPLSRLEVADAVTVRIGTLSLDAPKLELHNPDPELDALMASLTPAEDPTEAPGPSPDIRIGEIRASDGSAQLTLSEPEAFELAFAELAVQIEDLVASTGAMKQISIGGVVAGHAPLHIQGALTDGTTGKLTGVLEEIQLETFDPLVRGIGYRLEGGTASLDAAVELAGSTTTLDNEVTLHALELVSDDDGFQTTFGLPLDAALALMTDLDGAIQLTVPVELTGAGSEVALGGILRGALQEAILGALSSPLKIVGGVASFVGGDSDTTTLGPNEVAMRSATTEFLPDGEARIEAWAELLTERPQLGVVVHGVADPSEGGGTLADQRATLVRDRLATLVPEGAERISIGAAETTKTEPEPQPTAPEAPRVGARLRVDVVR
jgi:hypothetical protein